MPRDELDATTDVVTLAKSADGLGSNVARRLDDHGIETVADILIAERETLLAVPYVSETRADYIQETAEAVAGAVPREVDLDATQSVVSEAAIPLSVRRGDAVLTKTSAKGSVDIYHTQACPHVEANDLTERDAEWAERRGLDECRDCADPNARAEIASSETETEPPVDSREAALEATLGEKLDITMADRTGYANPWAVIDTEGPTTWETPTGDTWRTRRIRISQKMDGSETHRECDLVVAADEIRLEDPPVKGRASYAAMESWRVESVGAVGRVSQSVFVRLQGRLEQQEARPEGDDSWKQYHERGGTA